MITVNPRGAPTAIVTTTTFSGTVWIYNLSSYTDPLYISGAVAPEPTSEWSDPHSRPSEIVVS